MLKKEYQKNSIYLYFLKMTNKEKILQQFPDLKILDKGEIIKNKFSDTECYLEPEAVALYDFIQGSELMVSIFNWKPELMYKAINLFRELWPTEYLILLD